MTGFKKQLLQSLTKTKSDVRKLPSRPSSDTYVRIILKGLTMRWTPWWATAFTDSLLLLLLLFGGSCAFSDTNFHSPFRLAGITPNNSWLKAIQRRECSPHHGQKGSLGNWDCQQKLPGHCNTKMFFTHK